VSFYVGGRSLKVADAVTWLSRLCTYLSTFIISFKV